MKEGLVTAAGLLLLIGISCTRKAGNDVEDLSEWRDRDIRVMVEHFGEPKEQHSYTVGQAPTKGWNHGFIFSIYSKHEPNDLNVVIKEYAWSRNGYEIRACCHLVEGRWLVIGATKIQKDVRF